MNPDLPAIFTKLMPMNTHEDAHAFCVWSLGPDSPLTDAEKEVFSAATWEDLQEVASTISMEITVDEILIEIDGRILEIWAEYGRALALSYVYETAAPEHRQELSELFHRRELMAPS